ncbi:MAG: hypothetical protein LBK46_01100 [Oscillospiraceae bacterium]|nr:hypothetical protein [Oscillospiraceae bacterium]
MADHRVFRYLFLLPIVAMCILVAVFISIFDSSTTAVLEQKRHEIRQDLKLVADQCLVALGQGAEWVMDEEKYRTHIVNSIELLDKQPMTYAVVYQHTPDLPGSNPWGYSPISNRDYDTTEMLFDPFGDAQFRALIADNEHYPVSVIYEGQEAGQSRDKRSLHLYFRWTPMIPGQPDRYLMIIGVSMKSLNVDVIDSIGRTVVIMVVLTTALNIAMIAFLGMLTNCQKDGRGTEDQPNAEPRKQV